MVVKVTVKLFANFREAAGRGQVEVEGVADLGSLFNELVRKFGKKFSHQLYSPERELRDSVKILINGKVAEAKELGTALKDGDLVTIFPPVSGGSRMLISRGADVSFGMNPDGDSYALIWWDHA